MDKHSVCFMLDMWAKTIYIFSLNLSFQIIFLNIQQFLEARQELQLSSCVNINCYNYKSKFRFSNEYTWANKLFLYPSLIKYSLR